MDQTKSKSKYVNSLLPTLFDLGNEGTPNVRENRQWTSTKHLTSHYLTSFMPIKNTNFGRAWWHMPLVPERQRGPIFVVKANMVYMISSRTVRAM